MARKSKEKLMKLMFWRKANPPSATETPVQTKPTIDNCTDEDLAFTLFTRCQRYLENYGPQSYISRADFSSKSNLFVSVIEAGLTEVAKRVNDGQPHPHLSPVTQALAALSPLDLNDMTRVAQTVYDLFPDYARQNPNPWRTLDKTLAPAVT